MRISVFFRKTIPWLLYGLPILFFLVAYFLIISSGEDIVQGANSTPDVFGDATAAFLHSARLSDMYTWAVINFFDYKFSFGIDTIFRLVDLGMAFGIFYLMTDFIVGHKPKLNLKDGLVFVLCFLCVILTTNGRSFYAGFSVIHNYLIIGFTTLFFLTPYVHWLQGRRLPEKWWFSLLVCLIGFIFGVSSNLTPIVMILTFGVVFIVYLIKRKKIKWKKIFLSWQLYGILGVVLGVALFNVLGSGMGNYIDSNYAEIYDYLPFEQIFSDFSGSLIIIAKHLIYNFGRFLLPIIVIMAIVLSLKYFTAKKIKFDFDNNTKKLMFFLGVFVLIHLICVTQIEYPTRIVLPAYLVAVVIALTFFYDWLFKEQNEKMINIFSIASIALVAIIIGVKIFFAIDYRYKVEWVIEKIENPGISDFCVNADEIMSKNLPYIYLGQEDIIASWSVPVSTNGTTITYCDN